jgi:hypothetical protein
MARSVRSPDGRTWTLERVSQGKSFAERRQEPFFWPSLIATAIMLVFIVRLISVDGAGWFLWVVVVPLFVIWLLERGLSFARPNIRAHTDGPPAESHTWRTTHRIGLGRIENRIAEQIEQGRLEAEPSGAVLIGI